MVNGASPTCNLKDFFIVSKPYRPLCEPNLSRAWERERNTWESNAISTNGFRDVDDGSSISSDGRFWLRNDGK